jgi:hypothetical protein
MPLGSISQERVNRHGKRIARLVLERLQVTVVLAQHTALDLLLELRSLLHLEGIGRSWRNGAIAQEEHDAPRMAHLLTRR